MNSIYKRFGGLMLFSVLFMACEDDETANTSSITFYPEFEVTGASSLQIGINDDYVEPGILATEQGAQIDVSVSYTGRFTGFSGTEIPNTADQYTVNYSALNVDGFAGSASRTVFKIDNGDFVSSIAGLYSSTVVRSTGVTYSDILVLVWETAPNVYEISSYIGGYYGEGSGFGDGYLARGGTITVNDIATNDFTFGQAQFPIWGNVVDITSMTVDPATKTISYSTLADFGGMWDITMTQVEL
ncbi:MAG: DUF5012 domain-containing protein [Cyclobacteriaceae bacterium]